MNNQNEHKKISKAAVVVFAICASLIHLIGMGYCYLTGRTEVTIMIGVLLLTLILLAVRLYRTV
jgi:hypothetical protein